MQTAVTLKKTSLIAVAMKYKKDETLPAHPLTSVHGPYFRRRGTEFRLRLSRTVSDHDVALVAVNYRDSRRIQPSDSPAIQPTIQQVKITLESPIF
jgi:hypothetical protein